MTQTQASRGLAGAIAPSPTPEIESEMNNLRAVLERADNHFAALAERLHSVRMPEPPSNNSVKAVDNDAVTILGQQIRAVSVRLDQLSENIAYHLRTVALPN